MVGDKVGAAFFVRGRFKREVKDQVGDESFFG